MEVFVNGNKVGTAQVYTNEKLSHKAFVPAFAVVNNVPKGSVKIELKALNADTKTDQNDFFRVTVEEQPEVKGEVWLRSHTERVAVRLR